MLFVIFPRPLNLFSLPKIFILAAENVSEIFCILFVVITRKYVRTTKIFVFLDRKTVAKIVPYFDGQYLYEAALLNGGNAVSLFVKNLHKFVSQLNSIDDDGTFS